MITPVEHPAMGLVPEPSTFYPNIPAVFHLSASFPTCHPAPCDGFQSFESETTLQAR